MPVFQSILGNFAHLCARLSAEFCDNGYSCVETEFGYQDEMRVWQVEENICLYFEGLTIIENGICVRINFVELPSTKCAHHNKLI